MLIISSIRLFCQALAVDEVIGELSLGANEIDRWRVITRTMRVIFQAHGDTLRFDPALPPEIRHLRFSIHYRGHRIGIILTQDRLSVRSRPGPAPPIKIFALGQTRELAPGMRAEFQLERKQDPDTE